MGNASGLKAWQVLANAERVLAIELLAGAQGVEFLAPLQPGVGVRAAREHVRSLSPRLRDDRTLSGDIEAVAESIRDGSLVQAVEAEVGRALVSSGNGVNPKRRKSTRPYRDSALAYAALGSLVVIFAYVTGSTLLALARRRESPPSCSRPRTRGGACGRASGRRSGRERDRSLDATVEALCGDLSAIRAPRGSELNARSWSTEAPLRMLLNNLDAEVAERPEELVVYGGSGKAARNPEALRALVRSLLTLGRRRDAARPERQARRRLPDEPVRAARPDRELAARPALGDLGRVPPARGARPDDVRPDDGGELDLHRQPGDPAGHLPDLRGGRRAALRLRRPRRPDDPDRRARRDGRRAAAARRRSQARRSCASRSIPSESGGGSRRATWTRRPSRWTTRWSGCAPPRAEGRALSVGLLGNAAELVPELARRGEAFDFVTDQTAAHDPLTGYVPAGPRRRGCRCVARERPRRVPAPRARVDRRATSRGCSSTSERGSYVFDYGNNLRGEALEAGRRGRLRIPGLRPGLYPAALLPRRGALPLGRALGRSGRHRRHRPDAARAVPGRRRAAALARAGSRAGRIPGPAGADLLARLRRPRARRARDQRARPQRRGQGAGRDRPRPPRLRLGRLALPRDRGDAGRLRRDRRLADPERAAERGRRRDLGQRPSRRRRRDRQLDPRRHGRRRRRQRRAWPSGSSGC